MGTSWPAPERRHHKTFVETEGWTLRGKVAGGNGDHFRYELALPTGDLLWTKISHPPGKQGYGPRMWSHILKDQLRVTSEEFWACVENGEIPARSVPKPVAGTGIPIGVVNQLVNRFRVPEAEVMALTKEQAIERLGHLYSESPAET